jgi:hypothetical protein
VTTLVIVIALTLTAVAAAHRDAERPKWMDAFAWAVAICETGKGHNHPDFRHRAGSYEGAWGWYFGTWDLDKPKGYPDHAYQATPKQQLRVFRIGRSRGRYWGCIAHGGYRYWL